MLSPTTPHPTTRRRVGGLTDKGRAVVLLVAIRAGWEQLSPSQRQEVAELLERLSSIIRPELLPAT